MPAKKWVVKLGGSLAAKAELKKWLRVLAIRGKGRVVIVPGGGAFADQVRIAQQQWRFDDTAAHRMSLLAMEQYALMLCALETSLIPVSSLAEIDNVLSDQHVALWFPAAMLLDSIALPRNWDITSDSIAAWLAEQINATHLLLVKQWATEINKMTLDQLQMSGVVDVGFKQFVARACFKASILGKSDSDVFMP